MTYRPTPVSQFEKLKKFKLIHVRSIRYDPLDDHWLIDGLLPMTGLATIWGKYKTFKSFIAFAVAVAVADANLKKWGDRALQHGAVVYVVAEDMDGIDARIEAYRREMKHFDDLPLFIIKARPNLGAKLGDRQELIAAISEDLGDNCPLAIFLDTLARMLGGEGENDTGMQNFVDNAEAMAEAFRCLSIAVHHENAATDADPKADKPRGHSSLPGALVASWHVIKTGDGLDGPWTADIVVIGAKNSPTGFALKVTLKRVDLGENRHGRMETILVLDTVEWAASAEPGATKSKRELSSKALKLLLTCFRYVRDGKDGTERRQVRGHDGPWRDVVKSSRVREVFLRRYPNKDTTEDDDTKTPAQKRRAQQDRARKAYDRSVESAVKAEHLYAEPHPDSDETYLWGD